MASLPPKKCADMPKKASAGPGKSAPVDGKAHASKASGGKAKSTARSKLKSYKASI